MQREPAPSLYEALQISRDSSLQEIKASYRKLALKFHPDRNSDPHANEEFHKIGKAYEILSNPERRELYDTTGICDDSSLNQNKDWSEYFKALYAQVSTQSIDEFKSAYISSAEELEDILGSYIKHDGDILKVIDTIFFATTKDIDRIKETLKRCIRKGIVPSLPKFESGPNAKSINRKRKMEEEEAKEASKISEDLVQLIRGRRTGSLEAISAALEKKYSQPINKSKRTKK